MLRERKQKTAELAGGSAISTAKSEGPQAPRPGHQAARLPAHSWRDHFWHLMSSPTLPVPAKHCQAQATGFSCSHVPHALNTFCPKPPQTFQTATVRSRNLWPMCWNTRHCASFYREGDQAGSGRLWSPHLWRYAKAIWTQSWETGCGYLPPAQVPSSFHHPVTF